MTARKPTLAELERLLSEATPGPWSEEGRFLIRHFSATDTHGNWPAGRVVCMWDDNWDYQGDRALIAAMHAALPDLLRIARAVAGLSCYVRDDLCLMCHEPGEHVPDCAWVLARGMVET
jgi:hypothetical protein